MITSHEIKTDLTCNLLVFAHSRSFRNFPLQCSQVEYLLDTDEMDDSPPSIYTLSDAGQHGITVRSGWISHRQGWMNTRF